VNTAVNTVDNHNRLRCPRGQVNHWYAHKALSAPLACPFNAYEKAPLGPSVTSKHLNKALWERTQPAKHSKTPRLYHTMTQLTSTAQQPMQLPHDPRD
jgi:hypothetical protein